MKYQPVIGLEIHVELSTKTKMFCRCSADYFGKKPNTHTCPVCLGLPGALPYPNQQAIEDCIKIALALNCKINKASFFERKNYFYPDLPKGYQISQYLHPFGHGGYQDIKSEIRPFDFAQGKNTKFETNSNAQSKKRIRIRRVHMEEDTGKNIHTTVNGKKVSLLDFNRSGIPLVEIVSEPDIHSAEEAKIFLVELQKIVRHLGVSNADMEKGGMRLEPNISLARSALRVAGSQNNEPRATSQLPPYKIEVKNINSFRFVERAIDYEIERQTNLLEKGKIPIQETRGWNENKDATVSQRTKEEAHDYRYFPEPDIPPIHFVESQIANLKSQIGELPEEKLARFQKRYGLSAYDAEILSREKPISEYFEEAVKINEKLKNKSEKYTAIKSIANWIINKKVDIKTILPAQMIHSIIGSTQAAQINENELREIVRIIVKENQKAVDDYKQGKQQVLGFLIGQVKRKLPHADSTQTKLAIEELLK